MLNLNSYTNCALKCVKNEKWEKCKCLIDFSLLVYFRFLLSFRPVGLEAEWSEKREVFSVGKVESSLEKTERNSSASV